MQIPGDIHITPSLLSEMEECDALEYDRRFFRELTEMSLDADRLYDEFSAYVVQAGHDLFFSTNDLEMATQRHEQFRRTVQAMVKVLSEEGRMDAQKADSFQQLIAWGALQLRSYGELERMVEDKSEGETSELLAYVCMQDDISEELIAAQDDPAKTQAWIAKLHETAQDMYADLMHEYHGIPQETGRNQLLAMGHIYAQADQLALRLAQQRIKPEWDEESRNACYDEQGELVYSRLEKLSHEATSPLPIVQMAEDLHRELCKAGNVPENFTHIVNQAARNARALTEKALPRLYREARQAMRMQRAPARHYAQQQQIDVESYERCKTQWHATLDAFLPYLESADNRETLLRLFDDQMQMSAHDVVFKGNEPAVLRGMEYFVTSFAKALGEACRAQGHPSQEVRAGLDAIAQNYRHGFSLQQVVTDWCMEHTGGSHDNVVLQMLLRHSAETGRSYANFTPEDHFACLQQARKQHEALLAENHVPQEFRDYLFAPLIMQACRDKVEAERDREMRRPASDLPQKQASCAARENGDDAKEARLRTARAVKLFRDSMQALYPEGNIDDDASYRLNSVMECLAPSAMRTRH